MSNSPFSDLEFTNDEPKSRRVKVSAVPHRRLPIWAYGVALLVAVAAGLFIYDKLKEKYDWSRLQALKTETGEIWQAIRRREGEIESNDPELKRIDTLLDINRRDDGKMEKKEKQDQVRQENWRLAKNKEMDALFQERNRLDPIDDAPAYRALDERREAVRKELDDELDKWSATYGQHTRNALNLYAKHSARKTVVREGVMQNDPEILRLNRKAADVSAAIDYILKDRPEWWNRK